MEGGTKENSETVRKVEKENWITSMVIFILVNGWPIKSMVMEYITALPKVFTKEISFLTRKKEVVLCTTPMEIFMRVSGRRMYLMAKVFFIVILEVLKNMMAFGKMVSLWAKVYCTLGKVAAMRVTSKKILYFLNQFYFYYFPLIFSAQIISNMVMVFISVRMLLFLMVNGKKELEMVKPPLQ